MPHGDTIEGAHRLYRIALQRNFTRGRRTAQVYLSASYIQLLDVPHYGWPDTFDSPQAYWCQANPSWSHSCVLLALVIYVYTGTCRTSL